MADPFDAHRDNLANFEDDLVDLCYDIIDASYKSDNAYFVTQPDVLSGIYAAPADYVASVNAANPTPQPSDYDNDEFNHAKFREDISNLAQVELPVFLDGADVSQFAEAITRLGRATDNLEMASGYTGLEELITLLDKWDGEAARNFQRSVIPKYSMSIVHQLVFIDDLIATAICLQEIIERTRGDALGLAQNLLAKIGGESDSSITFETILWVAGAILAGVAAFAASGPVTAGVVATRVGYALSTATGAVGQVQKLSGSETGERPISGETAYEFIPSCQEQIDKVLRAGMDQVDAVMSALKADLSGEGADLLCISKPKVIDGEEFTLIDAGEQTHDFLVESVGDLRYAGVVTLPTMAYYFDKAYGEVSNLGYPFDAAIGQSTVVSGSRHNLDAAIEALANAFKDTRDYLYLAGVALKDIADAYFEDEASHEEMMNNFTAQLTEYQEGGEPLPTYAPGSNSPSTDR
jgi:hypothetical protein